MINNQDNGKQMVSLVQKNIDSYTTIFLTSYSIHSSAVNSAVPGM